MIGSENGDAALLVSCSSVTSARGRCAGGECSSPSSMNVGGARTGVLLRLSISSRFRAERGHNDESLVLGDEGVASLRSMSELGINKMEKGKSTVEKSGDPDELPHASLMVGNEPIVFARRSFSEADIDVCCLR